MRPTDLAALANVTVLGDEQRAARQRTAGQGRRGEDSNAYLPDRFRSTVDGA